MIEPRNRTLTLSHHAIRQAALTFGAFDLYFDSRSTFAAGFATQAPGGDIVLPAVPGTGHDGPFEIPFPEWATPMDTSIVDGVKCPVHIKRPRGSCRSLLRRYRGPASHRLCLSPERTLPLPVLSFRLSVMLSQTGF